MNLVHFTVQNYHIDSSSGKLVETGDFMLIKEEQNHPNSEPVSGTEVRQPYDNRWSKTMVGYGPEDNHFVVELTYNYNVNKYEQGNDYQGITIRSREAIARAKAAGWPIREENGLNVVEAPGGYKYFLVDEPQPADRDQTGGTRVAVPEARGNGWTRVAVSRREAAPDYVASHQCPYLLG
ncbi:Glyoxalase domain-containing protein 4 [Homalodisca vitripennis]|nr:Glyoxalase domain-containing protein 4 [Homalodisca vitripennis]